MEKDPILDQLNPSQREAVCYNDGPHLVIAGAGSGKTRVLTYKIAYLLRQGIYPQHVLALTFTNKAAAEMKERIAVLVGEELAARLWMGTFHSVFARILRMECDHLGFGPHFTIYDQRDAEALVKSIIKEMDLDEKVYKPHTVAGRISMAKNRLVTCDEYASSPRYYGTDAHAGIPQVPAIYTAYVQRLHQANAMDFDDLLLATYCLFDRCPEVLDRYASRFEYILVDEYQDTNYAQHCIIQQLAARHRRVCVVGDDAQSIYSFRGANIDNILSFSKLYEGARLFKLEQNYLSTQTIVDAANCLISHNNRQIPKKVVSMGSKGSPLRLLKTYSDMEEAAQVVRQVELLHHRDHVEYNNMAVLYRTNAQSRSFEEVLRAQGVPYRIFGGLSFYQRKEVKDAVAYCRLTVNPHDEEAFRRVINYPKRGIGDTTVSKLALAAVSQGISLWQVAQDPQQAGVTLAAGTLKKVREFVDLISSFVAAPADMPAHTLLRRILKDSGMIADLYQDNTAENLSRQQNIEELLNAAAAFVEQRQEMGSAEHLSLADYLQEVALLSDIDETGDEDERKLSLMTVHAAKGLEFEAVFVVGMEEGLFPQYQSTDNMRALEEERRLFYVALTRAKQYCFLSCAKSRYRYGKTEFCTPSRFLDEIDPCYFARPSAPTPPYDRVPRSTATLRPAAPAAPAAASRYSEMPTARVTGFKPLRPRAEAPAAPLRHTPTAAVAGGLTVGRTVVHQRFGRGVVEQLEGVGADAKATVVFDSFGRKTLLLRFATLEVVD